MSPPPKAWGSVMLAIQTYCIEHGDITITALSQYAGITRRRASVDLCTAHGRGHLRRVGVGRYVLRSLNDYSPRKSAESRAIEAICSMGYATAQRLSDALGISIRTARKKLSALHVAGLARRTANGRYVATQEVRS